MNSSLYQQFLANLPRHLTEAMDDLYCTPADIIRIFREHGWTPPSPTTGGNPRIHHPGVHKPFPDDGVMYCGWAGDGGIYEGCGQVWPCSATRDNRTEQ